MKKTGSQLSLGLVCIILGVMLSFQLKTTYTTGTFTSKRDFENITKELNSLKAQRDEINTKLLEYQKKVEGYEKAAASESDTAKLMKSEIDKLRFLSGMVDVQGAGITITITPVTDITTRETSPIGSSDLIDIINDLNSAGAEAISINDERYVGRTQIRDISGSIKINDSKFDNTQVFKIKAIGAPDTLDGALKYPGNIIEDMRKAGIEVKIDESANVKILKYNRNLDYKFMKKVGR